MYDIETSVKYTNSALRWACNYDIRGALSTSQWPAYSISDYHKAMIRCFSGGGFFAATLRNGATGCGSLQFDALPPEGH